MAFSNVLFNKIENGLIFTSDYRTFVKNNTISFSNAGIAVVYGPNGMYQRSELDYLIYNDPVAYAELILNGDPETYLKTVTEYKPLDS